jgi:hypothetical protein
LYLFLYVKPSGLPILSSYFLIVAVYYLTTYFVFGRSLFQLFFRWDIPHRRLAYTIVKVLFIGIIPFILTYFHSVSGILLYTIILMIPVSIIVGLITKKPLWQLLARSSMEKEKEITPGRPYFVGVIILFTVILLASSIKEYCFFQEEKTPFSNTRVSIPVSLPVKYKYAKNIREHKQDPVEYVMRLFEENDRVILCERVHPEYAQWQLFSQIILNDTFAAKVGNVFTELGNAENQQVLDDYMRTRFDSVEDLKKATARIVRENGGNWPLWSNKNIYDFILNLHEYNARRDSAHKINLFFTDKGIDWQRITNREQWHNSFNEDRDSMMAANIITQYNEQLNNHADRKKMLVIMNTRHAFKGVMPRDLSTADYLFKEFPAKTANVLINGSTQIITPIKSGLWDEIALAVGDTAWAVNFNACILGNDFFDIFPVPGSKNRKYKEVFNGMIYYQHPKDFRIVDGYEYMLDDFKDTYLHRSGIIGEEEHHILRRIANYEKNISHEHRQPLIKLFNLCFLCLHGLIMFFLWVNLIVLLIRRRKTSVIEK